ncbi:NAD(+) synthase [Tessaracoccus lacteus]|uniref:Glutamine-dependent NAD(+) synthetase n=1 Tax=Tessaracoccus lacteus TaxID=3041766 RepID=A0ABY8PYE7_9ACTN|nr:NAD(+) synthase [Tessaracoccus sp. T21]WGT47480.1 NAD(+) synthase [Tessaracoccus sp. T21]
MEFASLYSHGFARVAACTFHVALADPAANVGRIVEQATAAHNDGAAVALFPELSLSGYSLDDLLLADVLLDAVGDAIVALAEATAELTPLIVVGAPVEVGGSLYNCAVVLHEGQIRGVVPKTYLPNYREFYEKRHFVSGADAPSTLRRPGWPGADGDGEIPFGTDLIFRAGDLPDLSVFVEICEDMWVPLPPSTRAALAGANVVLNLSASPITIGRAEDRALMVRSQSARGAVAYLYAAACFGESTTDLSWDGQTIAYEAGDLLGASERFPLEGSRLVVDVDLDRLRQEKQRQNSLHDNAVASGVGPEDFRWIEFTLDPPSHDLGLRRPLDRFPFVPDDAARLEQDCYEGYNIQVSGLERRMLSMSGGDPAKAPRIVIGVSGGLDSTHALIVAAKACDRLGLPRTHILAYTLPGFATSGHTKNNATILSQALGVTFEEVEIRSMALSLLKALGHPAGDGEPVYDVTYENVQAGLRTDFLFRVANQRGGFVLGTGDLSELALGWCTYGVGDQMSHYAVNTGVPKTLMQHLIRWVISSGQFTEPQVNETLDSILGTEISPELIPVADGAKPQSTQDSIGPYSLHDFTLYYLLRRGYRPSKTAFLAWHAWRDEAAGDWPAGYPDEDRTSYDLATIKKWMRVFLRRFFSNQFKRTAIPNGPKVLAGGSLSPRGDWRMPSDASSAAWLSELDRNVPETC